MKIERGNICRLRDLNVNKLNEDAKKVRYKIQMGNKEYMVMKMHHSKIVTKGKKF